MNTMMRASVALAVVALSACAAVPRPSEVVGWRYQKTDLHSYPLTILSVDGRGELDPVVRLDPGVRDLVVQAPSTPTRRLGLTQPYRLEVAPCTRYYLVAVKENALSNQFTVRVDATEPLAGCLPPAGQS